jgi:hypothetical protein
MVTRESPKMAVRAHLHPLAWNRRDGQLHGLGFGRPRDAAGQDIDSLSAVAGEALSSYTILDPSLSLLWS